MLKSFDPNETWEYSSPLAPETVFTYTAITGPIIARDFEGLSTAAINRCVKKVTNIELTVTDKGKSVRRTFTGEEPFVPAVWPEVKLAEVLHYQIATGLFGAIWDHTTLTAQEMGE
jgi:hypothetical protein